jgi:hypothetical protein
MIQKRLPGFYFQEPKNRNVLNLRLSSVTVEVGTRPIRATWNPQLVQDLQAFHTFDAEAELTALLGHHLQQEIDNQIIQDLTHHGHRAPAELGHPDQGFGNLLPLAVRVNARTVGMDLINVQPLAAPQGILNFVGYHTAGQYTMGIDPYDIDTNYTVLPDGWYSNGTFESIMIKMDMKPFKFIPPKITRRGRRINLVPPTYIR